MAYNIGAIAGSIAAAIVLMYLCYLVIGVISGWVYFIHPNQKWATITSMLCISVAIILTSKLAIVELAIVLVVSLFLFWFVKKPGTPNRRNKSSETHSERS